MNPFRSEIHGRFPKTSWKKLIRAWITFYFFRRWLTNHPKIKVHLTGALSLIIIIVCGFLLLFTVWCLGTYVRKSSLADYAQDIQEQDAKKVCTSTEKVVYIDEEKKIVYCVEFYNHRQVTMRYFGEVK
jgi:hypothetical protein